MRISACFVLLLGYFTSSSALDITKAYQLIPHQQTPFYLKQSNLPESEARYISRLLSLSELAMAERVEAMVDGTLKSNYDSDINNILHRLGKLKTPSMLEPVYKHIIAAIKQQQSYFALMDSKGANSRLNQQNLVNNSSQHLRAAYSRLMSLYPEETKHNKQAFFDYLCALDFI